MPRTAIWRTPISGGRSRSPTVRAREQLFLRAAISRARLWCSLGRRADARALLNRASGGIAEGQGLADALDAAALAI